MKKQEKYMLKRLAKILEIEEIVTIFSFYPGDDDNGF